MRDLVTLFVYLFIINISCLHITYLVSNQRNSEIRSLKHLSQYWKWWLFTLLRSEYLYPSDDHDNIIMFMVLFDGDNRTIPTAFTSVVIVLLVTNEPHQLLVRC